MVAAIPAVILPVQSASALQPAVFNPPGFGLSSTGTDLPTSLTNFIDLPGGRILAIGKQGAVRQGLFGTNPWTTVDVNFLNPINSDVDRGLVGVDLAPDYASSGILYLLYDYNKTDCAPNEQAGSANTNNVCGRLSRFTANNPASPTALTNEVPILDQLPAFSATGIANDESHTVGTVLVAPDGTLFVGNGDASSFDPSGSGVNHDPTSFYAQDVNSPRGKIFHIDANGNGLPSNPSWDGNAASWRSKVYVSGVRNPFRFSLKPGTGTGGVAPVLYIGDVGSGSYEEIDVAKGGENFGWPCYEGPLTYRNEFSGDPVCAATYAQGTSGITAPLWTYAHAPTGTGHAIMGGAFAGANYGSLSGAYFFADATWGAMWTLRTDADDGLVSAPTSRDDVFAGPHNTDNNPPDGGIGIPVAIHMAPDGNLRYAELSSSRIYELQFCTSDCPPVAVATVTPGAGPPGTPFVFDATQSYAPSGGALSYSWNFGDGQSATGPTVTHTSGTRQTLTAKLTVTAGGKSSSANVVWSTLHNAPAITLTPNKPTAYSVGEPVAMTAAATGYTTSDQPVPIGDQNVRWNLVIHHCPFGIANGCHIHPSTPTPTPSGTHFNTVAPDHGDFAYLEFRATATDADGLSTTASFNLPMDNHTIFVSSNQPGVVVSVNGNSLATPASAIAAAASMNQIVAPPSANGVPFTQWSDGDPNPTKQFVMPAADVFFSACYGGACGAGGLPGKYTPVQPYRLFDTRNQAQSPNGVAAQIQPGQIMPVNLSNQPGRPAGSTAVLLNVTTTNPAAAGYVKAFPCGTEPYISNVNFDPGQTAANLAMVMVPADGNVCFSSFVPTDLVVDVSGWFAPASSGGVGYTTIDPVRVLDTRESAKLEPMQELRFSLAGRSGFPADATAALINLTATNTEAPGYVRVYPCGEEQDVSNVNYAAGQTVANLASVKVAAGGDVCFKSYARADIVVDLAGWYSPAGTSQFVAASPVRLFDTRSTPGLARLGAGQELAVQLGGAQVPAGATSAALNVTAAGPDADGYVAVYPCGTSPFVSNVNYRAGQVAAANLAVVKLPADGRVCFKSFAPTDIIVDLAGWYVG